MDVNADIIYELMMILVFFALGETCVISYGILEILRLLFKHKKSWIIIEDIGYWLLVAGAVFYVFLEMNQGRIRSYALIALLMGMLFFKKSIRVYWVNKIAEALQKR